jgi:hypothetical protein
LAAAQEAKIQTGLLARMERRNLHSSPNMPKGIPQVDRRHRTPRQTDQGVIQHTSNQITTPKRSAAMRTEAEIREHRRVIQEIIDLPGEVPDDLMVLTLSHIALLGWVLGEDTPEARHIETISKTIAKEMEAINADYAKRKNPEHPRMIFPTPGNFN